MTNHIVNDSPVPSQTTTYDYGIAGAAYYVPDARRHLRDWARDVGRHADRLISAMEANGLAYYHVAGAATVQDLADCATERLFATADLPPADIDLVLYCHSNATSVLAAPSSVSASLIHRFGMQRASGYAIAQQKCASAVRALGLIQTVLWRRPDIHNVLLVSADKAMSETLRNLGNYAISSDGAMALWIRRHESRNRICAYASRSDASYYRGAEKGEALLSRFSMNYPLTAYAILKELLTRADWKIHDVQALLPMNLNARTLKEISALLNLPADRIYTRNIGELGHVSCCDPFINFLDRFSVANGVTHGGKALLYASGSAGCFAGVAIDNVTTLGSIAGSNCSPTHQ